MDKSNQSWSGKRLIETSRSCYKLETYLFPTCFYHHFCSSYKYIFGKLVFVQSCENICSQHKLYLYHHFCIFCICFKLVGQHLALRKLFSQTAFGYFVFLLKCICVELNLVVGAWVGHPQSCWLNPLFFATICICIDFQLTTNLMLIIEFIQINFANFHDIWSW